MAHSRARRQVVILDSCYSGAFPPGLAIKDDGSIDIPDQFLPRAANPASDEGIAILTASTSTRYAFVQDSDPLSLYTRFLIQGIESGEADGNDNGFVTVGDLHEYARQRVQAARPAMQPGISVTGGGGAIAVAGVPVGDPLARYQKAVTHALDHRGDIAIAARPRLQDWRDRLGLDVATFETIEAEVTARHQKQFQDKRRQYANTLKKILEKGKPLADESTHLNKHRAELGLTEEDAQTIQSDIQTELAAEREQHEKSLERYTAFVRAAIKQEGTPLSEETRGQMAGLQKTLNLSDQDVTEIETKAIRESARKAKKPPEPQPKKKDMGALLGFWGGLLGFGAALLTIIAVGLDLGWWEPDTPPQPKPQGRVNPKDVTRQDEDSRSHAMRGNAYMPSSQRESLREPKDRSAFLPAQRGNKEMEQPKAQSAAPIAKPTPATPPPEPAKLWVNANPPQAMVTLDGKPIHSPHTLKAGQYTIRVSKPGYQPFEQRITLSAAEEKTLQTTLTPKPARLIVRSNISGSTVTIDGKAVGLSGPEAHQLTFGKHTIQVSKPGYEPFEQRITLSAGEEKTLQITLIPKPAGLISDIVITSYYSPPTVGSSDSETRQLTPDKHTVRVEKKGYKPLEREIVLAPGEEENIQAHLISRSHAVRGNEERGKAPVPVAGQTFQDRLKDGALGPRMVVIPAGEFLMGSPLTEKDRDDDEGPQRSVRIAGPFALGVTEVTFADYNRFARASKRKLPNDRGWGRGQRPVINVSWRDAVAYAEWLSNQTGQRYRLPSEAEWEYAARAGSTTPFSTGKCITTDQANYNGNHDYAGCGAGTGVYRKETVPAGSLPANPWGLYEMHGNVWEWTADCWHSNYKGAPVDGRAWDGKNGGSCSHRMLRGGSWDFEPRRLRSAFRDWAYDPSYTRGDIGFRLARAL
uniref:Formylglycine-generating enzyme, required for sulfatase activity, contains SUMF1/FGE domain n=1 Tax=Candidatus Kentrum sp. MB TaxID=2138164 RepID=A0A450Y0A8_9GAMM|nr:MAG: Formylglycine-generating enzyme, required for sulfatase activity, contains SUMF1/FGE domain [Candidatus Kentron sp. MB]VFK77064.1 MAG: Formylglycine-generating enzyme, required for sulfatase activity, contains SUMF1/FGE domain [Candidatus Kentron sp. MB]